jgi:hypothetical protein
MGVFGYVLSNRLIFFAAGSFKQKSRVPTWIMAVARYNALLALRSCSDAPRERRPQSLIRRRTPFS